MSDVLPGYDSWKENLPEEAPCVCGSPECEACEARQAAEDREAWAVDMAIDDWKENR